jgi:hypothetical protein
MASVTDTYFMTPRALTPVGDHVSNGAISSATTLTPPATANALLIQATGQNVRYTLDGTTPTASVGFVLRQDDQPLVIDLGVGMTVKVIEESATATIEYQWGRFN